MPSRPANASILRRSSNNLHRVYIERERERKRVSSVPDEQVASTDSDYTDDPSRPLKRLFGSLHLRRAMRDAHEKNFPGRAYSQSGLIKGYTTNLS